MPRDLNYIIGKAEELLDSKKRRLSEEGESFVLELSIHSLEQQIQDLKRKRKSETKASR